MPARSDTLFGYLARDSRPPDWRESAQTALQIWVFGAILLAAVALEYSTWRIMSGLLAFLGGFYSVLVAGRLAVTSASFGAYLTSHIQRFDLIRVSLLSDRDLMRTLFHLAFYHNRRSLAEALGGLAVVWMAVAGAEVWHLLQLLQSGRGTGTPANMLISLLIILGLWLLHPGAALIGILASLIVRRVEWTIALALAMFSAAVMALAAFFIGVGWSTLGPTLTLGGTVLACLAPILTLIALTYAATYALLRRR